MLTSVALLGRIQPSLETLPHVSRSIEAFLYDSSLWTLESAAASRHLHLLDRLAALEHPDVGPHFRQERFHHGVIKAAEDGNLDVLLWWTTEYLRDERLRCHPLAKTAAAYGHVHILQWLQDNGMRPEACPRLISNHADVLYWLHAQPGLEAHVSVCIDAAAKTGDLELMKWLQKHQDRFDVRCTSNALAIASARGDLEMIQWLLSNHSDAVHSEDGDLINRTDWIKLEPSEWPYRSFVNDYLQLPEPLEVTEAHLRLFRWLSTEYEWTASKSHPDPDGWTDKIAMHAAACNNFEMIEILNQRRWLDQRSPNRIERLLFVAALYGNFEMVQWLCKQSEMRYVSDAMSGAAAGGHLHIAQWLRDQIPFFTFHFAMEAAIKGPHLEMIRWMHQARSSYENGDSFRCSTYAMDYAAAQGQLDIVKWLHENRSEGCTASAMTDAAANGHLSVVQYLQEHRTEGCKTLAMDRAAANGHLEIVKFLHSLRLEGCTSHGMTRAASNGHLTVVRWLHEHSSQVWDQTTVDEAASSGHLKVVQFLTLQCQLKCSNSARRQAMRRGWFNVIEWLLVQDAATAHASSFNGGC